jgi:ankyrin repeat protein
MKAAFHGHIEVIVSLLLDGADVQYENEYNGKRAIHYAAEGNQPAAVKLLLEVLRRELNGSSSPPNRDDEPSPG